ncbi:MAG: NUDIX domain-containing protein [Candidatus Magasanikbacteria bacterium]|nr:NUDIX domain-containing protein [Candidatus Magasanikbacteria bacterium]
MTPKDGSKVFIKNNRLNKYLFVLRDNKPNIPNAGCWSLLGGGIENNETPLEALVREIKEETNIELFDIKKINIQKFVLTVNNKPFKVTGHIFHAYTDAELKNIKLYEGKKVAYFTIDELKKEKNISSGMIKFLEENKVFLN